MLEAQFEYKCRRCGEIHRNPCCGVEMARQLLIEISIAESGIRAPRGGSVHMYDVHRCDDDGEGLADLQGYRIDDTEEKQ